MELITIEEKRRKTELILANIMKLPSLPKILMEILEYLNQEDVNSHTLSKLIIKDQSLVTKILAIANSPLYGLQRKVSTIDFAVMVLGISEIRSIVSSLSMMEAFKNKTDKYLDQNSFWQHSYLVGSLSKKLCEDLSIKKSGEAFTAGFLHDIGISVIHKYFHSVFIAIYEQIEEQGTDFKDAELEHLGLSHNEIAYRLLDKWNLPELLCDIVRNHHKPVNSENYKTLSAVVNLADYITKNLNDGAYYWDKELEIDPESAKLLGFSTPDEINAFIGNYEEIVQEQLQSMRLLP